MKIINLNLVFFLLIGLSCSSNKTEKKREFMQRNIHFKSLDEFQSDLKFISEEQGLLGVKLWIESNLMKGDTISFDVGSNGEINQKITICDRKMILLDSNGIEVTNNNYLPTISEIDYTECDLFLSQRIQLNENPFGVVIYRNK